MVSADGLDLHPRVGRSARIIFEKETANFANRKITKVTIGSNLIEEARRLGNHASNRSAASAAFEHYIRHLKQIQILELAGTIDIDPDYDYKALRRLESAKLD